jgi:hypothetical protein
MLAGGLCPQLSKHFKAKNVLNKASGVISKWKRSKKAFCLA